MNKGNYSVIRCMPDTARGELLNIGIVIWAGGQFRVDIDQGAAKRAAKENPGLPADTFEHLSNPINERLWALTPINKTKFEKLRKNQRGTPYLFAQPQFVDVSGDSLDPLGESLERLMNRLVRPRTAVAKVKKSDEVAEDPQITLDLEEKVRPLINAGKVARKRVFRGKTSGKDRQIDFLFGTTALDILTIDPKDEEATIHDDGEAFKILDLVDDINVKEYYVLPFTKRGIVQGTLEEAQVTKAILSVGGKLVTNINEAEAVILRMVG